MSETQHDAPGPARRRVTLDIDVGVEPLSGILWADDVGHPFAGWLALASAIERLGRARPLEAE